MKSDELYLKRFVYLPDGVLGQLILPGGFECFTIERPWRNNQPYVSCVPDGRYELGYHLVSGKHFGQPLLLNVPDRSAILIHPANYASELMGCIGPGNDFGLEAKVPRVYDSRAAFDHIMQILGPAPYKIGTAPTLSVSMNKFLNIYSASGVHD